MKKQDSAESGASSGLYSAMTLMKKQRMMLRMMINPRRKRDLILEKVVRQGTGGVSGIQETTSGSRMTPTCTST